MGNLPYSCNTDSALSKLLWDRDKTNSDSSFVRLSIFLKLSTVEVRDSQATEPSDCDITQPSPSVWKFGIDVAGRSTDIVSKKRRITPYETANSHV